MAPVTVTYKLTDFGAGALASFQPRVDFRPSGPAVNGNSLFASKTISSTPAANGDGTVSLEPTDGMRPDRWYTVTIVWLTGDGKYVSKDLLDWKLRVPAGGGAIGGIIAVPSNPAQVWVGLEPPPNPTPGTWWLVADPNNLTDPTPSGDLYEWS